MSRVSETRDLNLPISNLAKDVKSGIKINLIVFSSLTLLMIQIISIRHKNISLDARIEINGYQMARPHFEKKAHQALSSTDGNEFVLKT